MGKEAPRPCEAPIHSPDCPCPTCVHHRCNKCRVITDDHTTGKAIGKRLGWNWQEISDNSNRSWLSQQCHAIKDKNTNQVLRELDEQRNGKFIGFGDHPQIGMIFPDDK